MKRHRSRLGVSFSVKEAAGVREMHYVQAKIVSELPLISELTGRQASSTALTPDCVFDGGFQLHLCEQQRPPKLLVADPAAQAQARVQIISGGVLLIPD